MKNKIISLILATFVVANINHAEESNRSEALKQDENKKGEINYSEKGSPLPLHTIEGYGGVLITPIAYLVNPNRVGDFGLPAVSATYVNARQKNVTSLSITQTIYDRVEFGFSASRFGTGSLQSDVIEGAGINIESDSVWLYNFNARLSVLKENSFDLSWIPAVTIAIQGKYNGNIADISSSLANGGVIGGLGSIGYSKDYGIDFVITASKAFDIYGHPLIFSLGGRAGEGAQLGYLGFGNEYNFTVEGNVVFGVTEWLLLAFEYRQKPNPYSNGLSPFIGSENDWWTIGAAFILSKHATLTVGYGHFGQVLNTKENTAWAAAIKYEF